MKGFLETLRNIYKIEDLRMRILTTLGLILIYRLGSYVVLPGIDPIILEQANQGNQGGLTGLLNMFAGGAFSRASIFALGIMPYISASIVIQLLGVAVPYFQRLQKEGESGRRKINQITRVLTILITFGQAPGYIASQVPNEAIIGGPSAFFNISTIIILTTGTLFVMWLGEKITDKGIGNGIFTFEDLIVYDKTGVPPKSDDSLAQGGRAGYQEAGSVMPGAMQMASMQAPQAPRPTDQGQDSPVQNLSYEELRSRLPSSITDDVVQLISSSQEALVDFANIQTQRDIKSFNQKYQVELVLPQEA